MNTVVLLNITLVQTTMLYHNDYTSDQGSTDQNWTEPDQRKMRNRGQGSTAFKKFASTRTRTVRGPTKKLRRQTGPGPTKIRKSRTNLVRCGPWIPARVIIRLVKLAMIYKLWHRDLNNDWPIFKGKLEHFILLTT